MGIFSAFFTTLWSWTLGIANVLFLFLDGLIYDIVSKIYQLFLLVCRLNFNSLEAVISPLVDRLKAVILVFIMFKVGMMLIQSMIDPDNITKASPKLIKNIFIVGAMLICYNLVFNILNEFSMLIVGVPDGYSFTTLSRIANVTDTSDNGLINRFVFGAETEVNDVGDFIAFNTLAMFIRDANDETQSTVLERTIQDGDTYKFTKVSDLSTEVNKSVVYSPFISGIMGLFIIFCIGSATLDVGVRMFKLIVLQLIAPIAIISKLDEKSDVFKRYTSIYLETYTSAFLRILSVLIMNVFISKFIINIDTFFGTALSDGENALTKIFLTVVIIVSGYMFIKKLPEFLKQVTGKELGGKDGKNFANVVASTLGVGAGALVGGVAGAAKGVGFGGKLAGFAAGAVSGAASGGYNGFKGNSVSDKIKNMSSSFKGDMSRAESFARNGVLGTAAGSVMGALGVKGAQDNKMERYNAVDSAYDAYNAAKVDEIKEQSASGLAGFSGSENVKYGSNKEEYAENMLKHNDRYNNAKSRLAAAKGAFAAEGVRNAQNKYDHCARALQNAQASGVNVDRAQQNYDNAKLQLEAAKESVAREIAAAQQEFDAARNEALSSASAEYDRALNSASGEAVLKSRNELETRSKIAGTLVRDSSGNMDVKKSREELSSRRSNLQNSNAYRRTHN